MSRWITVSSISFSVSGTKTLEEALAKTDQLIELAASDKPDLIVLPELFLLKCAEYSELPGGGFERTEDLGGPFVRHMGELARKHSCYLTVPLVLGRDGRRYNSLVLLDRRGNVAGVYDKVYPTIEEMEKPLDICPGQGPVTLETDFGKVGMLICFDLNFHDLREQYLEAEAELLVFSSMYRGGFQVRTWAYLNHCYLVSATPGDSSLFVDPMGRVFGESWERFGSIVTRRINLDYTVVHPGYNNIRFDEIRRRYEGRVSIEVFAPDAFTMLSSLDPDLSIQDVVREMGLEDARSYFKRSRDARTQAMESGPLTPGPSAW